MLDEARALSAEGIAVVRLSPFRRRHLPGVQAIADLLEPLDRAHPQPPGPGPSCRDRDLARGSRPARHTCGCSTRSPRRREDIARELGERRLPTNARVGLQRIGEASAVIDRVAGLSGEVMRAQIRSMVVDLLMLTGLSLERGPATWCPSR